MYKFIGQIILIGLFFGVLASAVTMFFGFAVYYTVDSLEIFISTYFLTYAAWIALAIGLLVTFAWYIYVLAFARKHLLRVIDQVVSDIKKEAKK